VVPRKIVVRVSVQKKKARIFFGEGSREARFNETTLTRQHLF
jgi:hypothetical protein